MIYDVQRVNAGCRMTAISEHIRSHPNQPNPEICRQQKTDTEVKVCAGHHDYYPIIKQSMSLSAS